MKVKERAWLLNSQVYFCIIELAKRNGKKVGDNMEAEFLEIMKQEKLKSSDFNNDDIMALEKEGFRILNFDELNK